MSLPYFAVIYKEAGKSYNEAVECPVRRGGLNPKILQTVWGAGYRFNKKYLDFNLERGEVSENGNSYFRLDTKYSDSNRRYY